MAERTPCFRRCSTIRVASPNQEGVERTDWEEVWMITDPSAILFIGASLMEVVLFFLLKEAHFYLCSLQVTSRCASRGRRSPLSLDMGYFTLRSLIAMTLIIVASGGVSFVRKQDIS